ncbi:MAG: tetratricopeptide repeat protein [Anaerolineales bacterium]
MNQSTAQIIAERYEVIKSLSGGMGMIYLCKDKADNDAPIALKTIQSKFLPNLDSREKFLHEATIWIELGCHPNIVQAYRAEYFIPLHEIYLALELIPIAPGRKDPSLRSWIIPNMPMQISKALKICLDITRGMKFASKKVPGLVHRDLKPENILLGLDGTARITDFGLVKVPNIKNKTKDQEKAIEGVGTPLYMSPEQWLDQPTFARTDIYSFGCIVYELLTGNLAVNGNTTDKLIQNHIQGMAFQKASNLNAHFSIKRFLINCLSPNPEKRFQTWEIVEKELVNLFQEVLNVKIEDESIAIDVGKLGQIRKGESLLAIGSSYLDIGNPNAAIEYYKRAVKIGEVQEYPELISSCIGNIGIAKFNLGKFQEALSLYQQAIEIGLKNRLLEIVALNFGNKGNAFFAMGDFKQAQEHFEKVIQLAVEVHDKYQEFLWKQNLANVYSITGNDKRALILYQEVYTFAESQKNLYGISNALVNIGIALDRLGNFLDSQTSFEKALQIAEELGDQKILLLALSGISQVFAHQNKIAEAIKYGEMALSIAERIKDQNATCMALGNLSTYYTAIGEFQKALPCVNQAIKLAKEVKNKQTVARGHLTLGYIMGMNGKISEAIKNLREATNLFKELGLPEYVEASKLLQELRKQLGLL